jgi:hypothetical protein
MYDVSAVDETDHVHEEQIQDVHVVHEKLV